MDEKVLELCNGKQYLGNNNFIIPNELTVTITLEEYRQLVSTVAKAELYKAQKTEWELKKEVEDLKQKIEKLTQTNFDLASANYSLCSKKDPDDVGMTVTCSM